MSPTPESISVNVYAVDTPDFRPGAIIALSNPVNLTAVKTDGSTTMFTFPAPLTLTDSFFVGLDLPIFTGDTIAIVTTHDDCVGFSNWSWEKWADGTWHSLLNSWVLDVDLAIFPVMDLPYNVGIEN
jgi:hypothetical protein